MKILINGSNVSDNPCLSYKGQGMISCNGSSRLLIDYKEKHLENYYKILEHLFGESGLKLTHLKLEMGSDVNTSSGTEPSVKRFSDEKADVHRGAGFMLAADVKKLFPDVTLDMLWWSEPRWVSDSDNRFEARYKWYRETLDSAYETYGLKFDYVSANRNERAVEGDWIIYLSNALKNEQNTPYDYSKIKIVAADECGTWNISAEMLKNPQLREAVDVIGSHYTSFFDENTKLLSEDFQKEIWFSEGSAPMAYSAGTYRFDEGNSGLTGINGVLDVANRMITMVSGGRMTMYEYQPAIAAYYDGVTYSHKQLINAATPWNGYYTLDSGYYMNLHFSQFLEKGWKFIFDACHADGTCGGDGHAIVNSRYSYMTACNDAGDYTIIISNTTPDAITYEISVSNLAKADETVYIYETAGPDDGMPYDSNYFKFKGELHPVSGSYTAVIRPYSLVTLSTLRKTINTVSSPKKEENTVLSLPYHMNLSFDEEFLTRRGGIPLYSTDEGGAFEISCQDGEHILTQQITTDTKAEEWGYTPEPVTNFGDDRWYNYSISADVKTDGYNSYAGVGLRYILGDRGRSGYSLLLYGSGYWELTADYTILLSGSLDGFDASKWHSLTLTAENNSIFAGIDNSQIAEYHACSDGFPAGRAALYTSYNRCSFKNICLSPSSHSCYCVRKIDNFDEEFRYGSNFWTHFTMDGFKSYKRTLSKGSKGAEVSISFSGRGIILAGPQEDGCRISISVDGETKEASLALKNTSDRREFYSINNLSDTCHTLVINVLEGTLALDEAQIPCNPSDVI